ncbi:unnamed protein product [Arctia plantaginis]|uniref:Peptidase M14 domain-containing protein n=1 Tax=Arctia plantaginis TaxID=874455 RepID=A0A8S0ZCL6_ARCPL|nr:unnamed protein product [Arctia plantaginis]
MSDQVPIILVKVARRDVRYQIWDVKCLKDGQRTFLKNLDSKGAITINRDDKGRTEVMVNGSRVMQVKNLLRSREIEYEVLTNDIFSTQYAMGMLPKRVRSPDSKRNRIQLPIGNSRVLDWTDFYPLPTIYNFLDELEKTFPSTCTVSIIGKTVEGLDIKLLKISNSNANNTGVWLDAATHAREWIGTSVVTFIANYIARKFSTLPEYITNKDWYFLPVVNPDGFQYSHLHDRMWRKNRACYGRTVTGVDLNRNFGYCWENTGAESAAIDPYSINYRGPSAFSEPETTAIKDIILYSGTPFKVFLTYHACSEVIAFPWCNTSDPCPDYVNLLEGGTTMAKAMYETNGRMYKVGNFKDIMYHACGTSIDWSYGTAHIPFSYLVELRSKQDRFLLPKGEILDCCKEALNGVIALMEFVDRKKCLNCTIITKALRQ